MNISVDNYNKFVKQLYANVFLLRLLIEFNFSPAKYLHPSQRKNFFNQEINDSVWSCQRVLPKLSKLILESLDLNNNLVQEIPNSNWCFLLLPPQRLARLARHIGAIVLGSTIRSSIARDEILNWKKNLGHDLFSFAMNGGMFFFSSKIKSENVFASDVELLGFQVMLSSIELESPSIVKRALLKFPDSLRPAQIETKAAQSLVHSVFFLMERQWDLLFNQIKREFESTNQGKY